MALTRTQDRMKLEFIEFKPQPDGSFSVRYAASYGWQDETGAGVYDSVKEYYGRPTIISSDQAESFRETLAMLIAAGAAEHLNTDLTTHTIVQVGSEFVEAPIS